MTLRLPQLLSNEISLFNNGQSRLPGRQSQVLLRSIRVRKYVLNFYYREVIGCGRRHRFAGIANQCRPANLPPPPPYQVANSTNNPIERHGDACCTVGDGSCCIIEPCCTCSFQPAHVSVGVFITAMIVIALVLVAYWAFNKT